MIQEDYISFESAKLLKEKGFNEECFALYNPDGVLIQSGIRLNNIQVGRVKGSYSAPTLQMAMKWLREIHKIFIEVYADKAYNSKDIIFNYEIWDENLNSIWRAGCFTTYEEACEAAIKYCLENLI